MLELSLPLQGEDCVIPFFINYVVQLWTRDTAYPQESEEDVHVHQSIDKYRLEVTLGTTEMQNNNKCRHSK